MPSNDALITTGFEKRRSGIIGSDARCSTMTNATNPTSATAASTSTTGSVHPVRPSSSAIIAAPMVTERSPAPA